MTSPNLAEFFFAARCAATKFYYSTDNRECEIILSLSVIQERLVDFEEIFVAPNIDANRVRFE